MMSTERARELLDAYGSKAANWPAEHRDELATFIEGHSELQAQLQSARALDDLLDSYRPASQNLIEDVLQALPRPLAQRVIDWLWPENLGDCWRPATAAAVPLLLGLLLGVQDYSGDSDYSDSTIAANDWEATEAALLQPFGTSDWYE